MFATLFGREIKQILRSLVYYLYILILALFLSTQLKDSDWVKDTAKPTPGQESYGLKASGDEQAVMGQTLADLVTEVDRETFATYPLGFYKGVTPGEEELQDLKKIVENCTGKSWDRLMEEQEAYYAQFDMQDTASSVKASQMYTVDPREGLTYGQFKKEMEKVVSIIGKGSDYEEKKFESGAAVPMTYEEALEEYQVMCESDKITGAYMRLFCDYAGIMLAFLPMFLGVTRCLRDKRAQAVQVIHARSASSVSIVLSRYLANVFMAFVPVVILGFFLQLPYCYHAYTLGIRPDYFAFLTYPVVWLLPEIMVVMAVAFLLTELSDKIFAIFIQIFWGLASIMSVSTLTGDFGGHLVCRWNTVGETTSYLAQKQELYLNRGLYAVAAVVLTVLCIGVYEKKRREGESLYGKIFQVRR